MSTKEGGGWVLLTVMGLIVTAMVVYVMVVSQ